MKKVTLIYFGLLTLLFQSIFSELMSIRGVRPDFIYIFILYISIMRGSFIGMTLGFLLGIFTDIISAGTSFGLSSLTYVITAYFGGFLSKVSERLLPLHFHITWITISLIHFAIFAYIQYQLLFSLNIFLWIQKWILLSLYTLCIIWVIQFVYPLRQK